MRATILINSRQNGRSAVPTALHFRPVPAHHSPTRKANIALWTVQLLLAAVFLFAGGMKLVMPLEVLAAQAHLPGEFMRFIGVAEFLGALGLVLPGLFRIRTDLTPLAAAGLVIIMTGATVSTAVSGPVAGALIPLIVGILAAIVVRGRWVWTAQHGSVPEPVLQRAA